MPDSVVAAVSLLEHPQEENASEFTVAAALYIADQISNRKTPPDPFPPEEWNTAYLRSIGCSEELKHWVRSDGGPA
jgi:hypothetical protein